MIENGGTQLPYGFCGSVAGWCELQPQASRVLRLPAEGIPEGSFLHVPDGEFDLIEVCLTESMGLKDQARRMGEHALQVMGDGSMDYESENLRRTLATLC